MLNLRHLMGSGAPTAAISQLMFQGCEDMETPIWRAHAQSLLAVAWHGPGRCSVCTDYGGTDCIFNGQGSQKYPDLNLGFHVVMNK